MAAATLTSPTDITSGVNTAIVSVTSDQATGTVYVVCTTSATTPSHAQIVAGQTHTGASARWACFQAAALSNSFQAANLVANTTYYAHFTQVNGSAEASTPVSGDGFTTRATAYSGFASELARSAVLSAITDLEG